MTTPNIPSTPETPATPAAPVKAPAAKRGKKVVESEGVAHICATFNNLLIPFVDFEIRPSGTFAFRLNAHVVLPFSLEECLYYHS